MGHVCMLYRRILVQIFIVVTLVLRICRVKKTGLAKAPEKKTGSCAELTSILRTCGYICLVQLC